MVLFSALLALAACQEPDVGGECDMTWGEGQAKPDAFCKPDSSGEPKEDGVACFSVAADYFESGNIACENLVCILSPTADGAKYDRGPGKGYCSKPCVSNKDCFESETGLVCRQMVLDAVFIKELERTNPALLSRYLGDIQFSSYCGLP